MTDFYVESPEFNDFLELFEEEELKEEHCNICDMKIFVRSTIEAEGYVCSSCANKSINEYIKNKK